MQNYTLFIILQINGKKKAFKLLFRSINAKKKAAL